MRQKFGLHYEEKNTSFSRGQRKQRLIVSSGALFMEHIMTRYVSRSRVLLGSICLALAVCSTVAVAQSPSDNNTKTGFEALRNNAAGRYNNADGYQALFSNTNGMFNTATGYQALFSNTDGLSNTAVGAYSLRENTTGVGNTALGQGAFRQNTTGVNGTAIGDSALLNNTTGQSNTAIGAIGLHHNVTGNNNTATGYFSLFENTTGSDNTASGSHALQHNTTGLNNTATGTSAGLNNTIGSDNTAIGYGALAVNTTGNRNVATGYKALIQSTVGNYNVAVGPYAACLTTGNNNIAIGSLGGAGESNIIRIGNTSSRVVSCPENVTVTAQTSTFIAGISGVPVTGAAVYINSNGQLGILGSSARFKKDVQSLGSGGQKLLSLRPVSFRYKQADERGAHPLQYGLIAEEVAKVFPELVQYDEHGAPFAVHYNSLAPLLLAELQNQHVETLNLQTANAKEQTALASLQEENQLLKTELSRLRAQVTQQQTSNTKQEAQNVELLQEIASLRTQARAQAALMDSFERKLIGLSRRAQVGRD